MSGRHAVPRPVARVLFALTAGLVLGTVSSCASDPPAGHPSKWLGAEWYDETTRSAVDPSPPRVFDPNAESK